MLLDCRSESSKLREDSKLSKPDSICRLCIKGCGRRWRQRLVSSGMAWKFRDASISLNDVFSRPQRKKTITRNSEKKYSDGSRKARTKRVSASRGTADGSELRFQTDLSFKPPPGNKEGSPMTSSAPKSSACRVHGGMVFGQLNLSP